MTAGRGMLVLTLVVEILIFSIISPHFASVGNGFEIARFSVELGLLAVASTPVIITGGIDLSVGSMLGLAAVVFGAASRDGHLSVAAAAVLALLTGLAGGVLNAALVTLFDIPPLIVTLGSLALFRGIAQAITEAARAYAGFPSSFLFLGQGYLAGVVPAQLPIFVLVIAAYAVVLHRSTVGRAWCAIGLSPAGSRYAGLRVKTLVAATYIACGVVSSLAAIVYVAHLGQARSDAGNGYELDAITAVVLGGASVAGGSGTIWGTLLGLLILSVLQNGLQLASVPSECTGVLTGVLLIATIALGRIRVGRRESSTTAPEEEVTVKNVQVAVLCAAILASGLLVAATNVWLVRSVTAGRGGSAAPTSAPAGGSAGGHRLVIAMMPKAKGDPYFVSCRAGAEEAARELDVDLIWDGPTTLDAARQNELVETWITRGVDAIAVSVENRASISTVLRKARAHGIRVIAWDADAEPDARDYFVNQATPEGIGNTLTDEAARLLGGKGDFAIVTGALSAANQNAWIAVIKQRLADKYSNLHLAVIRPSDDDRDKAFAETQTILQSHPEVKLIMAIAAPALPGAAEAVRQTGRHDIKVIGLSLPNINKPYVHDGTVQTVVLWNTTDLGYLTVEAAVLAARNQIPPGAQSLQAGRLGTVEVRGQEIVLGAPLVMTKDNIDRFDF